MFCGADLPLHAAQYMRDAHVMIVYHIGQMIGRELITLHDHWITFCGTHIVLHAAIDEILQWLLVLLELEAYAVWCILGQQWLQLLRGQMATFVVVTRHLPRAQRFLSQQLQATFSAEAAISVPRLQQALHCITVEKEQELVMNLMNLCPNL